MNLGYSELKDFLELKYNEYNSSEFIETDPIQIPHLFELKQDIEIAGFLTATIAWGKRETIIRNARKLMNLMDGSPFQFINSCEEKDLKVFDKFVHRTFNATDLRFFIHALRNLYTETESLENAFYPFDDLKKGIYNFREKMLQVNHEERSGKHLANPLAGSSAKRINMFLRWMVRNDNRNIDFGIWNEIKTKDLQLPLDVHTGNVSRKLGLLSRNQNDWKSVEEVTENLKLFDPNDPVKYDFALFGLGIFEGF